MNSANTETTIHCVLVSNSYDPVYLAFSGETVEDAVKELLAEKSEPLEKFGLDRQWLDKYGMEPLSEDYYPTYQNETRYVRWHGVFSDYESDDVMVDGYFVDFSEFEEEWCCLFVNAVGEVWIDYVDAVDEADLFLTLQQGDLNEIGFEFDSDDCNEAFPAGWVATRLQGFTTRKTMSQKVSEYFWNRTADFEDFGILRCYTFRR